MNPQRRKGYFNYEGKLSITDVLKEPGVLEFLQKNGLLNERSARNKLRALFRADEISKEMVDEYLGEVQNNPQLILRNQQRDAIEINGEQMTARQAFERYPQLHGYLQLGKRLKKGSLHAKLIKLHKKGGIPDHILNESPPNFQLIRGAMDVEVRDYLLDDPRISNYDIPSLFNYLRPQIINVMQQNFNTKAYLNIKTKMAKLGEDYKEDIFSFYSGEYEIFPGTDLNDVIRQMENTIVGRFVKLEQAVGSGWTLIGIMDVKMHFANYQPLSGSGYVKLPKKILAKKAVINIENKGDGRCFLDAMTVSLYPAAGIMGRVTPKLREQSRIFDVTNVSFPTTFDDIKVFEKNNSISVKVLGWDANTKEVVHLRSGNGRYKIAATLFLYEDHYCCVRNPSRLLSRQLGDEASHFCEHCCFNHRNKKAVEKHQEQCGKEKGEGSEETESNARKIYEAIMPDPNTKVRFKNYERTIEQPFFITADFESRLPTIEVKRGKGTTQYQEHIPTGYGYQLISRVDPNDNKFVKLSRMFASKTTLSSTSHKST